MATEILESAPWSMVKMVTLRSNFVVFNQRFTNLSIGNSNFVHGNGQKGYFLLKFNGELLG